jgi:DNA repair photolyase
MSEQYFKGRGAQINTANRFDKLVSDSNPARLLKEGETQLRTKFIDVHAKTILNKVESPDIPANYSMNPYQGCEHGCVYCYARNTHPFWGYSAGLDFEQKILIKRDAPKLLEEKLKSPKWKASPIMLSGNTDCYQPVEKELEITRRMLEILWKYRHPVSIITKNSLILRDLDILKKMNEHDLVHVAISITTRNEVLRQYLEPRTASSFARFTTVQKLSEAGIPTHVMIAPIIPGLNEHEILGIAEKASKLGASGIGYTMIRLNGDVAEIFEDWLRKVYPDRADKILNKIQEVHNGDLGSSEFKTRMTGEGNIAEIVKQQFKLAKKKFFSDRSLKSYNLELHQFFKQQQLRLFY